MIVNYIFKNFNCFREKVEFSMEAPRSKVKNRFPDNYIHLENGKDVLKTAVLVGENAGGKSSFVNSLEYFKHFFLVNERVKPYMDTVNSNNVKDICQKQNDVEQEFEIELSVDDRKTYHYVVRFDFLGIQKELLEVQYAGQKRKNVFQFSIVDRTLHCPSECEKIHCSIGGELGAEMLFSDEVPKKVADLLEEYLKNESTIGLFVSKLALLGISEAVEFIEAINEQLCIEGPNVSLDIYKSIKRDEDDLRILKDERYFDIFRMVDYSIVKIEVDDDKPFMDTVIHRRNAEGRVFKRKIKLDSSGVREFFAWAIQIYKVVYENKVIVADEMDKVLNPILSDRIIAFINGHDHQGQFIFTSHNALHLNLKTYMKEQIYFVTKNSETLESELYSLADFPDIRYETTKVYEFYMKGILGGTASE